MTYTIEVSSRPDGSDTAQCTFNGQIYRATSRHGVEMAVSRLLQVAGAPDGPWRTVGSGQSQTRLHGLSIHAISRVTVLEGNGRPRFAKWSPFAKIEEAGQRKGSTSNDFSCQRAQGMGHIRVI